MRACLLVATLLVGCSAGSSPTDLAPAADLSTVGAAPVYGGPCDGNGACGDGLVCLPGPTGGSFCTKLCPAGQSKKCEGTPAGTVAYCLITDANAAGDKACAFVCALAGVSHVCPRMLACAADEDPPGSGQRLCVPE